MNYTEYIKNAQKISPNLIRHKEFYSELMNDFNMSGYGNFYEFCYMVKYPGTNTCCEYENCENKKKFVNFKVGYSRGCSRTCNYKLNTIEKYGVEWVSQIDIVKEKKKKTFLDTYGVQNISQLDVVKEKKKKTSIEKYGVENVSQSNTVKEKKKNTFLKNYGVSHYFKLVDNIKNHNIVKYGVDNPLKNDEIKEKSKKTTIERHGGLGFQIVNSLQAARTVIEKKLYTGLVSGDKPYVYLNNDITFDEYLTRLKTNTQKVHCNKCHKEIAYDYEQPMYYRRCFECYPTSGITSMLETELNEYLDTFDIHKDINDRTVLNGKELDIFIPSKKIAIEFNGVYWHSELNGKDSKYHLDKTNKCGQNGIQLIHVFDTEWMNKREIVKSIIASKLGYYSSKIYAKNCEIKYIDNSTKNKFLENNHLQGNDKSSIKLGLYFEGLLVSVMTFGKSRYNKKYQYELHRFCNKLHYQVVGGASKLLKFFIRNIDPSSIITYADKRYSTGTFYEKIGFTKINESTPNYYYFKGSSILMSRIQFQKHKLKDKLTNFNPDLTEWENMQLNGYNRIWDCGNYVFEWVKK